MFKIQNENQTQCQNQAHVDLEQNRNDFLKHDHNSTSVDRTISNASNNRDFDVSFSLNMKTDAAPPGFPPPLSNTNLGPHEETSTDLEEG